MNSYFYKFMINLLKRFSSERKLLETRGAFIIRSEHPTSLTEAPEHPWDGWDGGSRVKQHKYYIRSEPKAFPQASFALQQTVLEQTGFAFHVSRHHISLSHPQRQSGSLLNSVVRACFVEKQLDQPEHEDRLALRVPSRVNPSSQLGEMLAHPKPCVAVCRAGRVCFSFLGSRGWRAKCCKCWNAKCRGSWQGVIFNAMKSRARDIHSSACWEITGLMVDARWRNQ